MTRRLYWYVAVTGFALFIFGIGGFFGLFVLEIVTAEPVLSLEILTGAAAIVITGLSLVGLSAYLEGVAT